MNSSNLPLNKSATRANTFTLRIISGLLFVILSCNFPITKEKTDLSLVKTHVSQNTQDTQPILSTIVSTSNSETASLSDGENSWGAIPPREVMVLPVFFIPNGEFAPTDDQTERLMRHLNWSQTRYRELLIDQATFAAAEQKPRVYQSERDLVFYEAQPEDSAPQVVSELLDELNFTRYNCPYILLVMMMNSKDDFPVGGGRPLNGGFNTGGGIIILSSFALDKSPNFQSTLQHELGHAFGLPHIDAFGYDMSSNDSIMSYNPRHHTNWFEPSMTPGKLIPEDLRGLALNQRVFPKLQFLADRDIPQGYMIVERIVTLGPMDIPGQPSGVNVTTESGEEYGSKVTNIVQGQIMANKKTGIVTFDPSTMWHSSKTLTGWVSVDIFFPYSIEITRVAVHSQHSGEYNAAQAVKVAVQDSNGMFQEVIEKNLTSADDILTLPKANGRAWRFEFQAGESGYVTLRGLQFYSGDDELFPPLITFQP